MSEFDFNRLRAAIADYFARKAPRDPVPSPPLSADEIIHLDAAAQTGQATTHHGGTLTCRGNAVWLDGEERHHSITAAILPRHVIEAAGLTAADVPYVRVFDE